LLLLFFFLYISGSDISGPCSVGPFLHGMARPRIADGGHGIQIWRVAANILIKQFRAAEMGWSSNFVLYSPQTWRAVVNTVMNLRVPQNIWNFLT